MDMMEVTSPSPNRQNSLNARDLNKQRVNTLPRFLLGPKPTNPNSLNRQKSNENNMIRQKSSSVSSYQNNNNMEANKENNPKGLNMMSHQGSARPIFSDNAMNNNKIGFSSNFQGILKKGNQQTSDNRRKQTVNTGPIPTASLGDYNYMNQSASMILSEEKKRSKNNFLSNNQRAFLESPIQTSMDRIEFEENNNLTKKNASFASSLPSEPKNFSTPNMPGNIPKSSLAQNNFQEPNPHTNDISPIYPIKEPGLKGFGSDQYNNNMNDNQHTPLARQMFEKKLNRQHNRQSSNTNSQEDPVLPNQFRNKNSNDDSIISPQTRSGKSNFMNHSGYSLDDELACWTTIYGFTSKNLDLILKKIFCCGSIVSRYPSRKTGSNWLHLRFATSNQAKRACSKYNNQILDLSNGTSVIIGLVECVESKYVLDYVKGENANGQFCSTNVNNSMSNAQESSNRNNHFMENSGIMRNAQGGQKDYEDDFLVPEKDNDGVLKKTFNYLWGAK